MICGSPVHFVRRQQRARTRRFAKERKFSTLSLVLKARCSVEPVKTSSFQLPAAERVDVVFVRLANGKLVPRHPSELIERPTPPAPPAGGESR
jgi:hypothetical protein